MAKYDNRYIQFYTPGTAAVKVQVQEEQNWAPLPEVKPKKRITVAVDPVALIGFAVAVCMLILMAVGINRLNGARREVAVLEHYVAQLTVQNNQLQESYTAGYDLSEVRQAALDMGMVPAEEIPQRQIYITVPSSRSEEPATGWAQLTAFLSSVFA